MYVSYANLWNLLHLRGISKTELAELAGISSRTLAKLSKNESVTVETLARICGALHCSVEEILCITEDYAPVSLYDAFRSSAKCVADAPHTKLYTVTYQGTAFRIFVTKETATALTVIRCKDDAVWWEEMPSGWRLAGKLAGAADPVFAIRPTAQKGAITVVVISGKPGQILELDEGVFRSARHPGTDENIHVMSMTAFKAFVPGKE